MGREGHCSGLVLCGASTSYEDVGADPSISEIAFSQFKAIR
jgi:hypothetical protein